MEADAGVERSLAGRQAPRLGHPHWLAPAPMCATIVYEYSMAVPWPQKHDILAKISLKRPSAEIPILPTIRSKIFPNT